MKLTRMTSSLTDHVIRFCRSKVKVTSGHWAGKCIHVNAGMSKSSSLWHQHSRNINGEVILLITNSYQQLQGFCCHWRLSVCPDDISKTDAAGVTTDMFYHEYRKTIYFGGQKVMRHKISAGMVFALF